MAMAHELPPATPTMPRNFEAGAQKYWRFFIADTGSPYDVIKRDHLMQQEAASLGAAPNSVKLHGAGGIIESGQVATAHLKTLHESSTHGP